MQFADVALVPTFNKEHVDISHITEGLKHQLRLVFTVLPFAKEHEGVMYWLGTNMGDSEYQNPCLANKVIVTASKFSQKDMKYGHNLDYFVSNKMGYIHTPGDEKHAWFAVNLEPSDAFVQPTHYTLCTMLEQSWVFLRNWSLMGSTDGNVWVVVKKHENDRTFNQDHRCHTFQVDCTDWFSHFKIYNDGPSDDRSDHLCCSALELYGRVKRSPTLKYKK
jgi:hypothetical protein